MKRIGEAYWANAHVLYEIYVIIPKWYTIIAGYAFWWFCWEQSLRLTSKGANLCVLTVLRFSWDIIVCILPLGFFAWSLLWLVIVSPLRIWFVYVVNMHLHLHLCLCLCAHCNARMSAREIKWEETYNSLNHMDNRLFTKQTANKNSAMAKIKQINCVAPVCVCVVQHFLA